MSAPGLIPEGGWPTLSIVIPCRNEVRYIGRCLESVFSAAYPHDRLEVLLADGMSDDGTREVIARYAAADSRITLLDNPARITPTGLNAAIRAAKGEVVVRMDAHAEYPREYLPRLVAALEETQADNVGGILVTLPGEDSPRGRAIALGMSHRLGVGNSQFRVGTSSRRWVDHVAFGCWRRALFEQVGLFDEELIRGQDVEFNARVIRRGGRVLLLPDIVSRYHARRTFGQVARMFYQYGYFKPLVAMKAGRIMTVRQMVPPLFLLAFVSAAAASLWWPVAFLVWASIAGAYSLVVLGCALGAVPRHGARCALALLGVFPLLHVGYGLGYLRGLWDHWLCFWKPPRPSAAVALTR